MAVAGVGVRVVAEAAVAEVVGYGGGGGMAVVEEGICG